eukprot:6183107-Pleurochrysis_carterae.AAC.1
MGTVSASSMVAVSDLWNTIVKCQLCLLEAVLHYWLAASERHTANGVCRYDDTSDRTWYSHNTQL